MKTYDVIIIGAGIIGCSSAYYLAKEGLKVAVIDRSKIGFEQSSRAWGFIRQQGRHCAEIPIAKHALSLWDEITNEVGFDSTKFVRQGILVPAETPEDENFINSGYQTASSNGLNVEIIDKKELLSILPELSGDWRGALYSPEDGHGDPELSCLSIAKAAKALGVKFFIGEPVTQFLYKKNLFEGVKTVTEKYYSNSIIVAAGIGSRKLASQLNINLPIQIIRSSVTQTTRTIPFTKLAMWAPTVAYRPHIDGSFTLGNGYRGQGTDYDLTLESFQNLRYFFPAFIRNWKLLRFAISKDLWCSIQNTYSKDQKYYSLPEPPINHKKINANLQSFRDLFPHIDIMNHARSWAGRLDITPDLIPIIDQPIPNQHLYFACGFSGHGFALGPSIGQQLSKWILDGKPEIDLSPFRYRRFLDGSAEYVKAL